ncbi:hypothetical protein NL676_025470 [Syzygium grande]|nr:hypothetical protein NL676_025470 [Syzygium grande]
MGVGERRQKELHDPSLSLWGLSSFCIDVSKTRAVCSDHTLRVALSVRLSMHGSVDRAGPRSGGSRGTHEVGGRDPPGLADSSSSRNPPPARD